MLKFQDLLTYQKCHTVTPKYAMKAIQVLRYAFQEISVGTSSIADQTFCLFRLQFGQSDAQNIKMTSVIVFLSLRPSPVLFTQFEALCSLLGTFDHKILCDHIFSGITFSMYVYCNKHQTARRPLCDVPEVPRFSSLSLFYILCKTGTTCRSTVGFSASTILSQKQNSLFLHFYNKDLVNI